jgi:Protein of unknown function (DUF4240)
VERHEFWQVIADARRVAGRDDDAFVAHLTRQLQDLPLPAVASFDGVQDDLLDEAYRSNLWAAAYVINGGCSDDGFLYFRAWLVAQGQQVFENALTDPASLEQAIVLEPGWDAEFEDFLYVAREVYESRAGVKLPLREKPFPQLIGEDWDEDSVDELFPPLSEKANSRFVS